MHPFFRAPLAYLSVWWRTLKPPDEMSEEARQGTRQAIQALAKRLGWDPSLSAKCKFSREGVRQAPKLMGVYHLYVGEELVYVGSSTVNLNQRLRRHLWHSHSDGIHRLIESEEAELKWYISPFCRWMERCDLHKYRLQYGSLPIHNRNMPGDL
jgi:hypothetical protein